MHACAGRVGDNYIRASVFIDEILRQHVFHVAGKEQCVLYAVDFRIDFGVFNGFGHIFNPDDLACLLGYEVGNGSCTGIKVVDQFVTGESGKVTGNFV